MGEQRSLFDGPPAPPPGDADNPEYWPKGSDQYSDYLAWRDTPDGRVTWCYMCVNSGQSMRDQVAAGVKRPRVSISLLTERVRDIYHISIRNTFRAWLADDLIEFNPSLLGVLRRTARTKSKV